MLIEEMTEAVDERSVGGYVSKSGADGGSRYCISLLLDDLSFSGYTVRGSPYMLG